MWSISDDLYGESRRTKIVRKFNEICDGIKVIKKSELVLLGAPLFQEAVEYSLTPKLKNLELMISRLKEIDNHEALFLLRHCFAIPKVTYYLRSSPCFLVPSILEDFDQVLKTGVIEILNVSLSEMAYNQVILPISKGGLGLRSAKEIAISGYLSSVCATISAVNLLQPENSSYVEDSYWLMAFQQWKNLSAKTEEPSKPIYQSSWDKEICDQNYQNLLISAPNKEEKARLLAVASPNASDWLEAIPIPALGLKLDPMSHKISCSLRLGSPLCHQYTCVCGVVVEPLGRHGLSCRFQIGRFSRHDEINSLLKWALVQAKIPAINEPSNLSRKDGKRPDGLTLTTWKNGKNLIWDVTVADTVCQSYINQSSKIAGAAADYREELKTQKYSELAEKYWFAPVAIESMGSWGAIGHKLVKEIGKKVMEATGETRSTEFLFQAISIALQRGNASCVIGTVPHSEGLEEIFEFVSNS